MRHVTFALLMMSAAAFSQEKMNCDPNTGLVDGACLAQKQIRNGNGPECKQDGTQQDMNICAGLDFEEAEKALNETYKIVIAKLSKTDQQVMRQKQRLWLRKRDRDCNEHVKQFEGGSIRPQVFLTCMKEATDRRVAELIVGVLK
jgi:uncharacterized protein YecT (DUF1311 family)